MSRYDHATGIKRYKAMYDHRKQWFGENNRHTIMIQRKLARHILESIETIKYPYEEKMSRIELLQWAHQLLLEASEKVVDANYRNKIMKDIGLVKELLAASSLESNKV